MYPSLLKMPVACCASFGLHGTCCDTLLIHAVPGCGTLQKPHPVFNQTPCLPGAAMNPCVGDLHFGFRGMRDLELGLDDRGNTMYAMSLLGLSIRGEPSVMSYSQAGRLAVNGTTRLWDAEAGASPLDPLANGPRSLTNGTVLYEGGRLRLLLAAPSCSCPHPMPASSGQPHPSARTPFLPLIWTWA